MRNNWISLLMYFGGLAALFGPMGCASSGIPEGECEFTSQCPQNFMCRNFECVATGSDGAMCGANERFVDGRCQPVSCACRSDEDCPGERCVDCACYPRACEVGQTRDCNTACGGKQDCRNGVWQPCRQPETERCGDSLDNDCNGQIDEGCSCTENQERPCSNSCGGGTEVCTNGMFSGCSAPTPRPEVCGNNADENCDGQLDDGCECTQAGSTRQCATDCGEGTETCNGENFAGCTAQIPQDEFCDGLDNDCNGIADDNLTRDCSNACGNGVEACTDGQWLGCDAPANCACADGQVDQQVCSVVGGSPCGTRSRTCNGEVWSEWTECQALADACAPGTIVVDNCPTGCGQERRVCSASCEWSVSPCTGAGECTPGDRRENPEPNLCLGSPEVCSNDCRWVTDAAPGNDESACTVPGEEETSDCGNCGTKTRRCLPCYRWSDWSACNNEPPDACSPGDEELQGCGQNCQTQRRVCQSDCTWSDFGECSSGGECTPSEIRTESCGLCGSKQQTCTDECIWSDISDCTGEGECNPNEPNPSGATARCDDALGSLGLCAAGTVTRACDPNTCLWTNWSDCSQDPDPEVCGNDFDENCDGVVEYNPDNFEPNNACSSCTLLSNSDDPAGQLEASIDRNGDVDYYCFRGDDALSVPFVLDESIEIRLTSIPDGSDYDVYLYQGLGSNDAERRQNAIDNCENNNELNRRDENGNLLEGYNSGNANESISWDERIPGNDTGFYIIKVKGIYGSSCTQDYTLSYDGLN